MDVRDFLQMLFTPDLSPEMKLKLAQQLAANAPAPAMPQPPGMDFMLNPQTPPQNPIPQVPELPWIRPLPQGDTQQTAKANPVAMAALTAEQMKQFSGMLGGDQKVLPPPGIPAQRALMPMAQFPATRQFPPIATLAMLLQGRQ